MRVAILGVDSDKIPTRVGQALTNDCIDCTAYKRLQSDDVDCTAYKCLQTIKQSNSLHKISNVARFGMDFCTNPSTFVSLRSSGTYSARDSRFLKLPSSTSPSKTSNTDNSRYEMELAFSITQKRYLTNGAKAACERYLSDYSDT